MSYHETSGRMRHRGYGEAIAATALADVAPADGISGCVMLVRRAVFERIGQLPDAYFYSFEDLDFCIRARRAGFATVLAGNARAYHEGNRSIGRHSPARLYFAARNHLLLARRLDAAGNPFFYGRAAAITALNVAHALRGTGGSLAARLGAVVRGLRDYALGRYGAGSESRRLKR
jgi:GT2 family glycosyltransferase